MVGLLSYLQYFLCLFRANLTVRWLQISVTPPANCLSRKKRRSNKNFSGINLYWVERRGEGNIVSCQTVIVSKSLSRSVFLFVHENIYVLSKVCTYVCTGYEYAGTSICVFTCHTAKNRQEHTESGSALNFFLACHSKRGGPNLAEQSLLLVAWFLVSISTVHVH